MKVTYKEIKEGRKVYFASDFHLGVPTYEASRKREDKIVQWLDDIKSDAQIIFLVGDIFDFWFEYKHAVPKGYVRFLGKIAELSDSGIEIHFFTGNHDMWMFDYLPKELGIHLHRDNKVFQFNGTTVFIGHGDGKGPGDKGYKFIKKVFSNKFCQWMFARLHPNFGIGLANYFSKSSRASTGDESKFLGEDNEWLIQYCKRKLESNHYDYFIFGHRHLPIEFNISSNSQYINLGDWIEYDTYAVLANAKIELKKR